MNSIGYNESVDMTPNPAYSTSRPEATDTYSEIEEETADNTTDTPNTADPHFTYVPTYI